MEGSMDQESPTKHHKCNKGYYRFRENTLI